jgi:hypothetical protein
VRRDFGCFADADDQQPLCGQAGRGVQQESFAGVGAKFAAVENGLGGFLKGWVGGEQADFGLRVFRFAGAEVGCENDEEVGRKGCERVRAKVYLHRISD